MKTYIIDLDNTLAMDIKVPGDFEHDIDWILEHKVCDQGMKEKIITAYNNGDRIVFHSARSNTGKRMKQTREWLLKNEVRFNEIILGKPKGDVYIDNDSCKAEEWRP